MGSSQSLTCCRNASTFTKSEVSVPKTFTPKITTTITFTNNIRISSDNTMQTLSTLPKPSNVHKPLSYIPYKQENIWQKRNSNNTMSQNFSPGKVHTLNKSLSINTITNSNPNDTSSIANHDLSCNGTLLNIPVNSNINETSLSVSTPGNRTNGNESKTSGTPKNYKERHNSNIGSKDNNSQIPSKRSQTKRHYNKAETTLRVAFLPIHVINDKLPEIKTIKKLLKDFKLIDGDTDEIVVNSIIKCGQYIRVASNTLLFKYDNKETKINGNSQGELEKDKMIIIMKGGVYYKDNNKTLNYNGKTIFNTAILKEQYDSFVLGTSGKHAYGLNIDLEKYKIALKEYEDRKAEEKIQFLKELYGFRNTEKKILNAISLKMDYVKYGNREGLVEENVLPERIYILLEGTIICAKGDIMIQVNESTEIVGDISLFTQEPSCFSYYIEKDSEVYTISFQSLKEAYNNSFQYNSTIIQNIFSYAVKKSDIFNKYFSSSNMDSGFSLFDGRVYRDEIIINKLQNKIVLGLSGNGYKIKVENNNKKYCSPVVRFKPTLTIGKKGEMVDYAIQFKNSSNVIFTSYECVVGESKWNDILKAIRSYTDKNYTGYDGVNMVKTHLVSKYNGKDLSELKIFRLAESFKTIRFKANEELISNGPFSNRGYIIISGTVNVVVDTMVIKYLYDHDSFGNITGKKIEAHDGSIPTSYRSLSNIDGFYIEKSAYQGIIENKFLKTFNKMLSRADSFCGRAAHIQLNQGYYIKEIGHGSYGKVYLVYDKENRKIHAMKTADIEQMALNQVNAQYYIDEKAIMSNINFTFIVKMRTTFKTRDYIFFLGEYVNGGSMRTIVEQYKKSDNLRNGDEVRFYGCILSLILDYLETKRVIHRDLKPDNLIVDDTGYLKAIDFGIAKDITGKDYTSTILGTHQYMAPEMIMGNMYSFSVDYWSMGVVLYEIFYGKIPFGFGVDDPKKIYKEIKEKKPILPSDAKNEKFNDLGHELLRKNPDNRIIGGNKIKNHEFFKGFDFDEVGNRKMKPPFIPDVDKLYNHNNKKGGLGHEKRGCPFNQFLQNNIMCSSNELDVLMQKKEEDDIFSDF